MSEPERHLYLVETQGDDARVVAEMRDLDWKLTPGGPDWAKGMKAALDAMLDFDQGPDE